MPEAKMKRNPYAHRPLSTSSQRIRQGIRWKLIFLTVILVLAVPKAGILLSSVSWDAFQASGLALLKLIPRGDHGPATNESQSAEADGTLVPETGTAALTPADGLQLNDSPDLLERIIQVGQGDTIMGLLLQAGLVQAEAHAAVSALSQVYDPRDLRPGDELVLTFRAGGDKDGEGFFEELKMQVDVDRNILVQRGDNKEFTALEEQWELQRVSSVAQGRIESSLYEAAVQSGLPKPVLLQMIRAYSFDVDFQRDIHPGDTFEVLFERQVDLEGRPVREGPVLYANLQTRGRSLKIYRYTALDGETDFFNEKGQSVRKALMLTPIDGARISSGFGMRRHPILGFSRMHKGLDFAAPTGTPIMAAGDGVVVEAGRKGNFGITVVLRHPNEHRTLYAHMSRIARGVTPGVRVKQGQVIGYVGSTGMSTGPHLHYEVLYRGKHVNPASVVSPPGRTLAGKDLEQFKKLALELKGQYAALADKKLTQVQDGDQSVRLN